MNLTIRPFKLKDLDRVESIEIDNFPNPWSRNFLYNRYSIEPEFFLVAEAEEDVVGYIVGGIEKRRGLVGHIMNVSVMNGFRGKGIGTKLLREQERKFRDNNINAVFLEVRESNTRAKKLYKKLGYQVAFIFERYYGDENAIVMTKNLEKR